MSNVTQSIHATLAPNYFYNGMRAQVLLVFRMNDDIEDLKEFQIELKNVTITLEGCDYS